MDNIMGMDGKALLILKAIVEANKCETNYLDETLSALVYDENNVQNALMAVTCHFDDMNIEDKVKLCVALVDFNDAFDEIINITTSLQEHYGFEVD